MKVFFLFSLIMNFIEFQIFCKDLILFFVLKLLFFLLTFIISLLLFSLKIIGGSDGKIFILIFLIHPVKYLNVDFIISFFLLFTLIFILLSLKKFSINSVGKDSCSFKILFNFTFKISKFKKFYIKTFYKFINLSELKNYKGDKEVIKSLIIIFNNSKKKFQLLTQYRGPLIIVCVFSYYIIYFLNIGI